MELPGANFTPPIQALIGAITSFLLGAAQLIRAARPLVRYLLSMRNRKPEDAQKPDRLLRPWSIAAGLLLVLLSGAFLYVPQIVAQNKPLNVRLTNEAWGAFNARNWALAIAKADECIKEFQGHADEQQADLAKTPQPPEGEVSEQEKKQIFKLGLINDVAISFWIKGRASQELGRKEEAKQAFQAAAKYTHARCYDPGGWFWNPAKDARLRFKKL
jgi:hypothetical protein